MDGATCTVWVQTSEKRLRQGDALAGFLFNLVHEKAVRDSKIQIEGTIFDRTVKLYIVGRSFREVEAFLALERDADRSDLQVYTSKIKYMVTGPIPQPGETVNIDTHIFEKVSEFS